MRKMDQVACVVGHHVVSGLIECEDAKTLVIQPVSTNAIAMKNAGVRGQAGEDSGAGIALGPV